MAKIKEKIQINLANNLKAYRKKHGLDQYAFAEAARLEKPTIAGYEQMLRFPKPHQLRQLAEACGMTPTQLLEAPGYEPKVSIPSDDLIIEMLRRRFEENSVDPIVKRIRALDEKGRKRVLQTLSSEEDRTKYEFNELTESPKARKAKP